MVLALAGDSTITKFLTMWAGKGVTAGSSGKENRNGQPLRNVKIGRKDVG